MAVGDRRQVSEEVIAENDFFVMVKEKSIASEKAGARCVIRFVIYSSDSSDAEGLRCEDGGFQLTSEDPADFQSYIDSLQNLVNSAPTIIEDKDE